jgi:hypothetical protein
MAVLVLSFDLSAAEIRFIEVEREDNLYRLKSIAWFDVKSDALYGVLTDYEQFSRFTSAIVESKNLDPDEKGRPRYYTRMEGCVLLWCKSFIRIGHLTLQPTSEIVAITNPEESDFKRSRERWQLIREGDGTLLVYEFEMVPDFWVPPVIGPFYIKRALASGGERALDRIEALARGEEPAPF